MVALLLGLTPPATAAGPRFAVPSGSVGKFSVVMAEESVTLELDASGYDQDQMREILAETQGRNPRLSDTIREDFQEYTNSMPPGGGGDPNDLPDFDGQLSITDTGIAIRIDGGEPLTNASWWAQILAAAAGVLTGLVVRSICIGFFPEAAVMCVSIGNFSGGMTRGIITQAIDGTLKDAKAWANTLAQSIVLAAGGAAWEAGVNRWSKEVLPGHIERLGEALVRLGERLAAGWATFREGCAAAGAFLEDIGRNLADAVSRVRVPAMLRVMPLGDSITYGVESSDGNGYRDELYAYLKASAPDVDFVGSVRAGSMSDRDNEGHPGDRIGEIAAFAYCSVPRYQPNVITLHAGTNDMNQNYNLSQAPTRLKKLINQALTHSPRATVLVAKLIPTGKDGLQPRIDAYNAALPGMVEDLQSEGKHVLLVDMSRVLVSDGLENDAHPTDAGYAKMADAWYGAVLQANAKGWIQTPLPEEAANGCDPTESPIDDDPGTDSPIGSGETALGEGWRALGVIAPGYGTRTGRTIIAELNGDQRADYLQVAADGHFRASVNTVGTPGQPDWVDVGTYAPAASDASEPIDVNGDEVRFADLNGDGRDDYLLVGSDSKVRAYINFPGPDNKLKFLHWGIVFDEESFSRDNVRFADVTGDGRDDILRVGAEGAVHVYRNMWDPNSPPISSESQPPDWGLWLNWAGGTRGSSLEAVRFADGDGDGRADYLQVGVDGSVHAFLNRGGGGNGSFEARYNWAYASHYPRPYVQFADISGDGKTDYLVVYDGGSVRAWLNRGGN
ncbi:GDSL-type esterase/lipase family protein [Nonomuraea angiospora]|uniref:GDSL-type esterase/lipase family protein n=1 Tax=Nonomuraea angiospora TaxID=46172 RepID=UPI003450CA74